MQLSTCPQPSFFGMNQVALRALRDWPNDHQPIETLQGHPLEERKDLERLLQDVHAKCVLLILKIGSDMRERIVWPSNSEPNGPLELN